MWTKNHILNYRRFRFNMSDLEKIISVAFAVNLIAFAIYPWLRRIKADIPPETEGIPERYERPKPKKSFYCPGPDEICEYGRSAFLGTGYEVLDIETCAYLLTEAKYYARAHVRKPGGTYEEIEEIVRDKIAYLDLLDSDPESGIFHLMMGDRAWGTEEIFPG
jgi:hypothetical protein